MKITVLSILMLTAAAQAGELAGHYYLQNAREVGSELELKSDGSFEYMLAYGAADYWAKGKWQSQDGAVILNSTAGEAKSPFRLLRSAGSKAPGIRVWVTAPNGRPVPNIDVGLQATAGPADARTDSEGVAFFPGAKSAKALTFRIRVYGFESKAFELNPADNEFYFEINGDEIMQIRFRGERLAIDGKSLIMRYWGEDHPMRYSR
jgi:hypothetical protein